MKYRSFFDVIILAGGESKRFGSDKCNFEFNMKTFIKRVAENFTNPIIVTHVKRDISNAIQVIDNERKGPVSGVKLALPYVTKEKVFITGCDFPFITFELASFICSKKAEISIVKENELQPLLACYSFILLKEFINKVRSLQELLEYAKTIYIIGTAELQLNGFSLYQLKNINKWSDFLISPHTYTLSEYVQKG